MSASLFSRNHRISRHPVSFAKAFMIFAWIGCGLAGTFAYAIGELAPLDLTRFRPAAGTGKFLTVDVGQVGSTADDAPLSGLRPEFTSQLFVDYAYRPLVFTLGGKHVLDDGTVLPDIVKHRLTGNVSFALSLWRRFQVALSLPVTFWQSGETVPSQFIPSGASPLPDLVTAGQGDLRLILKGILLDTSLWERGRDLNFGIALMGDLSFHTGNADNFMGSRLPTFNLKLIGSMSYKRFSMALNLGANFQEPYGLFTTSQLTGNPESGPGFGVQTGHGLTYGVGIQGEVVKKASWSMFLLGEVFGVSHYPFQTLRQSPAELTVALKFVTQSGVSVFLGGGPGLNPGYGTPDGRAYAGISYAWHKKKDPEQLPLPPPPAPVYPPLPPPPVYVCLGLTGPNGMPYTEVPEGFLQLPDGSCKPIVCKGMKDQDGNPLVKVPADHVELPDGSCTIIVCKNMKDAGGNFYTRVPEGYVQLNDSSCKPVVCKNMKNTDGNPLLDIPSGYLMNDKGDCYLPPPRKAMKISGQIFFAFNKKDIKPQSYSVLDGVIKAMLLALNMQVRVDGHTDSKGGEVYNIDLSQRRSKEVMMYLAGEIPGTEPYASKRGQTTFVPKYGKQKGKKVPVRPNFYVTMSRLSYLGFGKTCPLEAGDAEKSRQLNRRVEFVVIVDEDGRQTSPVERCDVTKMGKILDEARAQKAASGPKPKRSGRRGNR